MAQSQSGGSSQALERDALPLDPDLAGGEAEHAQAGDRSRRHHKAQRTIYQVVAGAGMIGALARYAMGRLIVVPDGRFPVSTFVINLTGSLVIGFVLVLLSERFPRARAARPLVATGFLGAYTTFSTYMVDTDLLLRGHDFATAAIYALSSVVGGAAAVFVGMVAARSVVRLDHHLNEQLG